MSRRPQVKLSNTFDLSCIVQADYSDLKVPLTVIWQFQPARSISVVVGAVGVRGGAACRAEERGQKPGGASAADLEASRLVCLFNPGLTFMRPPHSWGIGK